MKKIIIAIFVIVIGLINESLFSQELWTATATNGAPAGRALFTIIWASSKMVVWGGDNSSGPLNIGGIYDPVSNTWVATSTTNAPDGRYTHTAVWTGSLMLVWGGFGTGYLRTGGRFDPVANIWSNIDTANAPTGRSGHTAIWTGSKMIVWGGYGSITGQTNTGGIYDPVTNSWSAISTTNAPSARNSHVAIWTGSKMIVWGGDSTGGYTIQTGGVYDPVSNSWTTTSTQNAPSPRDEHSVVWTGSKMIVWGGHNYPANGYLYDGGIYDPTSNSWTGTSLSNAPDARANNTAVWTGLKMVIWGGQNGVGGNNTFNTGGIYDPALDNWSSTTTSNAPSARTYHKTVWTGNSMIVWGGTALSYYTTGGIYTNSILTVTQNISNILPTQFALFQNYPNPFNPSTNIKYQIPKTGFVNLTIYDVLGKEIATLVNQNLQAGTYEVDWNGTNYPSGVYFYIMIAGDYSETRKMVLIK